MLKKLGYLIELCMDLERVDDASALVEALTPNPV
jgi:hypothetical protein